MTPDGIGNFSKSFQGLTNCRSVSQTLSQLIPRFDSHVIIQIPGLTLRDLKKARAQQVCNTPDGATLIKLGLLPITYTPIDEFNIINMEIGVKVVNSQTNNNAGNQLLNLNFILPQGRVYNGKHFISVEAFPKNGGLTVIKNHWGKVQLSSVNGKPIQFYNYSKILLDNMKMAVSGYYKKIRITDNNTMLSTGDGQSKIRQINTDIVLDGDSLLYTFGTKDKVEMEKMTEMITLSDVTDKMHNKEFRINENNDDTFSDEQGFNEEGSLDQSNFQAINITEGAGDVLKRYVRSTAPPTYQKMINTTEKAIEVRLKFSANGQVIYSFNNMNVHFYYLTRETLGCKSITFQMIIELHARADLDLKRAVRWRV